MSYQSIECELFSVNVYFLNDFIYLFVEREEERDKKVETNIDI